MCKEIKSTVIMKKTVRLLAIPALLCCLLACGCTRQTMKVTGADTEMLVVDSALNAIQDSDYLSYLAPIKENLEKQLDIHLGYAPEEMLRNRIDSKLLNWACDALAERARKYYDGEVDLAVVNAGGLRCDWAAGEITFRSVFELMPFDNELVILTLSGRELYELAENCVTLGGQGVSKEFRVVGLNGQVEQVLLCGKPIDPDRKYHVATSDYLAGGADGLTALTHYSDKVLTGKKMRDLYIDYIAEYQTVQAELDGRVTLIEDPSK